jgi:hypothetical protein
VIERTAAVPEAWRVRDRAGHVLLCALRGVGKVVAESEAGRDGRCECAPGSVRVEAVDPRGAEFVKLVSVEQQIDDVVFRALDGKR